MAYSNDLKQSYPISIHPETGENCIQIYDQTFDVLPDAIIELEMFRRNSKLALPYQQKKQKSPYPVYHHLKKAYCNIWPHYEKTWNPWTTTTFQTFANRGFQVVSLAGGGSVGKSMNAAAYALEWWWANPTQRTVLVASTTIDALKKRIWSYIGSLYLQGERLGMPGILTMNPSPRIQHSKKDTKHGIYTVALKSGDVDRTLADLIGIHPEDDLLVIVDEATDVTPAIVEAIGNWDSPAHGFQMIAIGNSDKRDDTHGLLCEPLGGWDSVSPDTHDRWLTKYGICLYFDCYKSPHYLFPENKNWRFLVGAESIKKKTAIWGTDHPNFWRFVRGFWSKSTESKTILTKDIINKKQLDKPAHFASSDVIYFAGLDPAYTEGGDRCVLRIAKYGADISGKMKLDFLGKQGIHILPLSQKSTEPIGSQIALQTDKILKQYSIPPEHLVVDCWGIGLLLQDSFKSMKGYGNTNFLNSGGKVIDTYISLDENEEEQKESEIYDRRVTQLWLNFQKFSLSGNIAGLDPGAGLEFCLRTWEYKNKKQRLQTKAEFRDAGLASATGNKSCDLADPCVFILDLARSFGFYPGMESSANFEHFNSADEPLLIESSPMSEEDWEFQFTGKLKI